MPWGQKGRRDGAERRRAHGLADGVHPGGEAQAAAGCSAAVGMPPGRTLPYRRCREGKPTETASAGATRQQAAAALLLLRSCSQLSCSASCAAMRLLQSRSSMRLTRSTARGDTSRQPGPE